MPFSCCTKDPAVSGGNTWPACSRITREGVWDGQRGGVLLETSYLRSPDCRSCRAYRAQFFPVGVIIAPVLSLCVPWLIEVRNIPASRYQHYLPFLGEIEAPGF